MTIQINTDNNITGSEELRVPLIALISEELSRFSLHITRLEVHISDENGKKDGPNDIRCMMEARLEGRHAIAVTDQATTLDQAVEDAADKLAHLIESTLERQHDQELRRTDPPLPEPKFTQSA